MGETMSKLSNFEGIRHFSPTSKVDQWGSPSMISRELLEKLDAFRAMINCPVIVTSGFRASSQGSQHQLGLAVDIVAVGFSGTLHDLYLAAERFNFKGIGVYPDWTYVGKKVGGLHLDVRTGPPARWIGIGRGKDNTYVKFTEANLKKYGVVS